MKKKVLLSSVLTIILCLCLIVGSTFALFTSTTKFNIAVTAGDVDITASADIVAINSAIGTDGDAEDEFLVDENGHNYVHEEQEDYFLNGGTATLEGANLTIVRFTPGDRVDVNIDVVNNSNVAISYRYKIVADKADLASGMVVTVDDIAYEGLCSYTSEWFSAKAEDGTPDAIASKPISVELPVYAGNEYEKKEVTYTITVEAVQGNAVTVRNDDTSDSHGSTGFTDDELAAEEAGHGNPLVIGSCRNVNRRGITAEALGQCSQCGLNGSKRSSRTAITGRIVTGGRHIHRHITGEGVCFLIQQLLIQRSTIRDRTIGTNHVVYVCLTTNRGQLYSAGIGGNSIHDGNFDCHIYTSPE